MSRADDPAINRRRLSAELRRARDKSGLTQHQAADALEWSVSKIIRIEKGTVGLSVTDLRALLQEYGVDDPERVSSLTEAARRSKGQSWWAEYKEVIDPKFALYLGYEGAAKTIRAFHPIHFPGFLQTTDYTLALMEPDGKPEVARRIAELRAARQRRLFDEMGGPETYFILDEAAIRRRIGDPTVMRRQLEHVRERMAQDRVRLRVLPFTAGAHYSTAGSFTLLSFEDDEDLVNVESLTGILASRDDLELIAAYQECFEHLDTRALSDAATAELIDRALEDLGTS